MRFFLLVGICLLFPAAGVAATLRVPQDYDTIQKAINKSLDGDTVMVALGTYFEKIDFKGKAIVVKSESGPHATVIDGGQRLSVVQFKNGEGLDSVLEGFSITNGSGTEYDNFRPSGGGICCLYGSSPTIRGNIIHGNAAWERGGGIGCYKSSPLIEKNIIHGNSVTKYSHCWGGGIDCVYGSSPTIRENVIYGNWAWGSFHGYGGGIAIYKESNPVILNNTIYGNYAFFWGGGIFCRTFNTIVNNTIYGNEAPYGGGIRCIKIQPIISNTILWNNKATIEGPEIAWRDFIPMPTHCNIKGGWPAGEGNIDEDPLFVDPKNGDFHLSWRSPCINRGENNTIITHDIEGDRRPFMGTYDMGSDEFTGVHSLEADAFSFSAATGGKVDFTLNAGAANGNRGYFILGSVSSTNPGMVLPGGAVVFPLNWDAFTDLMTGYLNTNLFQDFAASLDSSGTSWAGLDTLGPTPGTAGLVLSFAFALNEPWDFASNPVNISILP
jgi:hypothetical protein